MCTGCIAVWSCVFQHVLCLLCKEYTNLAFLLCQWFGLIYFKQMSKGCDSTCSQIKYVSAFINIKGVMGTVLLCVYVCPLSPSHCVISPLNSQNKVAHWCVNLLTSFWSSTFCCLIIQCLQIQIEIRTLFVKMYPLHMRVMTCEHIKQIFKVNLNSSQ